MLGYASQKMLGDIEGSLVNVMKPFVFDNCHLSKLDPRLPTETGG